MAGGAVAAKLALVGIIGSVAGGAGGRRAFVDAVGVAGLAPDRLVRAGEREVR